MAQVCMIANYLLLQYYVYMFGVFRNVFSRWCLSGPSLGVTMLTNQTLLSETLHGK